MRSEPEEDNAPERSFVRHMAQDERRVAINERLDGEPDALLGQAAHVQQPRFQLLQLRLEVRDVSSRIVR